MRAFCATGEEKTKRSIGNEQWLIHRAFFEIAHKSFPIRVRHLVDVHTENPLLFSVLTCSLRVHYLDDSFNRSFRQINSHKQERSDGGQLGVRETGARK